MQEPWQGKEVGGKRGGTRNDGNNVTWEAEEGWI